MCVECQLLDQIILNGKDKINLLKVKRRLNDMNKIHKIGQEMKAAYPEKKKFNNHKFLHRS